MQFEQRAASSKIFRILMMSLTAVMLIFYIIFGFVLIIKKSFAPQVLDDTMQMVFGIMLLAYGSFRSWRMYKTFITPDEE